MVAGKAVDFVRSCYYSVWRVGQPTRLYWGRYCFADASAPWFHSAQNYFGSVDWINDDQDYTDPARMGEQWDYHGLTVRPYFKGDCAAPKQPDVIGGTLESGGVGRPLPAHVGGGVLLAGGGVKPEIGGGVLVGGGVFDLEKTGGGVLVGGGVFDLEKTGGGVLVGGGEDGCVGLTTICSPSFLTRPLIADVVGTGATAIFTGRYTMPLLNVGSATWTTLGMGISGLPLFIQLHCDGAWQLTVNASAGPASSDTLTAGPTRPIHFNPATLPDFAGLVSAIVVTVREPSTCRAVPFGGGVLLSGESRATTASGGGVLLSGDQYIRPFGGGVLLGGGMRHDTLPSGGGVLLGGSVPGYSPARGGVLLGGSVPGYSPARGGVLLGGSVPAHAEVSGGVTLSGSADLQGDSPATTCSPATMKRQMWATIDNLGLGAVPTGTYPFLLDESSMIWSVPTAFLPPNITQLRFLCGGSGLWFWDSLDDVGTPWANFIFSWTGPPYVGAQSTDIDVTSPYYPGIWGVTFFQGES